MNMIVKYSIAFFLFLLFNSTLTFAQFPWLVKPIIEYEKFIYKPGHTKELIVIIGSNGRQGVMKINGEILFPTNTFARVNFISGNGCSYGVTEDKKLIAFNSQGTILSEGYDELNSYHHSSIIFAKNNNLFGLIDTLGNVVKETIYKNLKRVKRGLYQGSLPDGTTETFTVEESDGLTPRLRATNTGIRSSKIKDRILISSKSKKRGYTYYGFTNMEGDTILAPDRYYSNFLSMGFESQVMIAFDSETEKEGMFDKDANIVVPFEYDKIWRGIIADKYIIASKGNNYSIITVDGKTIGSMKADKMYPMRQHPFVKAEIDKKVHLLTPELKPAIDETFDAVRDPFKKDFTILAKNKLRGFYSFRTGKYTMPQFTKFKMPALDRFGVSKGTHYGLFDVHTGQFLTDTIYSNIQKQGQYYLATIERKDSVLKDSVYKKITKRIYTLYDSLGQVTYGPTENPLFRVTKDVFKERITLDSSVVHHFETGEKLYFNTRLSLRKGNILVFGKDEYGFRDELFDPKRETYEFLSTITENIRRFKRNGKYGILHNRNIVMEAQFDKISNIKEGTIKVKINGKWGVLKNPYYKK